MAHIHQLSELLISQIKAGEVVERPASALKELLDNAIDSGASNIKASIEKGGLGLISVEDDGEGIHPEDLPLAFARHATSKIRTFEDLSTAMTMGFRGEALASLAAIARCKITSQREGGEAFEISAENGQVGAATAAIRRNGTTVSAADLFFYVPARRKFLKSEQTESSHCRDAFARAALSRPDIAMSFFKDGKQVYRLPAQSALERVKSLIGSSFSGAVATVNAEIAPYKIQGFAAPLGALPSGKETQLLFVNRRYARDKLLTHAAKEALIQSRGLGREREVAFVLHLELPPELVDANAHPAKTEVRFKDGRTAHQFVYKALSEALAQLPPPQPLPDTAAPHRPLTSILREDEQDLFGNIARTEQDANAVSSPRKLEISNDAERFIGLLRSGSACWDSTKGLWLAAPNVLGSIEKAMAIAESAENGTLSAVQQIIPARCTGLSEHKIHLAARKSQLQSMGLELEWLGANEAKIIFAPEGFDNCDWALALPAMSACLSKGRMDALSLSLALCIGLPADEFGDDHLWNCARKWMEARRLARELPGSSFIAM